MANLKFKVGDYVKVIKSEGTGNSSRDKVTIGKVFKIIRINDGDTFPYHVEYLNKRYYTLDWDDMPYDIFDESEIVLATEKEILAWMI